MADPRAGRTSWPSGVPSTSGCPRRRAVVRARPSAWPPPTPRPSPARRAEAIPGSYRGGITSPPRLPLDHEQATLRRDLRAGDRGHLHHHLGPLSLRQLALQLGARLQRDLLLLAGADADLAQGQRETSDREPDDERARSGGRSAAELEHELALAQPAREQ